MTQENSHSIILPSDTNRNSIQNLPMPTKISPPEVLEIPPSTPNKEKDWLQWALQTFASKTVKFWRKFRSGSSRSEADEELKESTSGEESRVRRLAFGYEAPPDEHKGCTLIFYSLTSNILGVMLLTFAIGVIIVLTLIFMAKWSDGTWRKW